MSLAETEEILSEARRTSNHAVRGKIQVKAKRYLRLHERRRKQDERDGLDRQLSQKNEARAAISSMGRADMIKYRNTLEDELASDSPPDKMDGDTRDRLVARERELAEKIRTGMPPTEVMRRNPPGAVAQHQAWQRTTQTYIDEWKNLRVLNNADSDDPDLANVETLRPSMTPLNGAATYMAGAQIPGVFAMTPQAKANWPENMPELGTLNSPLRQADERELREQIESLKAQLAEKDEVKKQKRIQNKVRSDVSKLEARERMKKYWANKKAQAAPVEGV